MCLSLVSLNISEGLMIFQRGLILAFWLVEEG